MTEATAVGAAGRSRHGPAEPVAEVDVQAEGARIAAAMGSVVVGKPDVVRLALVVLLAEGHLLIEDVPGVGKTPSPRRWHGRWTARCGASSSPRTCCPAT
ncbi:hypothetical protein TEK04_04665 [Klenkia sp. LSe6-5]|uniref:MoxR-like ATPase n=1 Tax=Klenkia sesuvii TaxID=3103137 RepID=A0ABU8DRE1_9ACTN